MELAKARDIIDHYLRENASPAKMLRSYSKNLLRLGNYRIFDPKMYEALLQHGDKDLVTSVKTYLDGIGFAQSLYDYSQIQAQLENFLKPGASYKGWNQNYKKALSTVKAEVSNAKLSVIRYTCDQDIIDAIPKSDTHAGFDCIPYGWKKKGEYFDGIFAFWEKHITEALEKGTFNAPIMIGTRTQASGAFDEDDNPTGTFKKKSRLVSMIALRVILAELMFAKPFQAWLSSTEWYAGGKSDEQINPYIQSFVTKGYHMLTIDYSNYDQSIPAWLIYDAFDVVKEAFNGGDFDEKIWKIVVHDFIHKVFLSANNRLDYVSKGVPSGSMFTQIIDSIVNRIMVLTYLNSLDSNVRRARKSDGDYEYVRAGSTQREIKEISRTTKMMIMGDDNIIFTVWKIKEEDLAGYLGNMFGVTINAAKCSYTAPYGYPEFLSRVWTPGGVYRSPKVLISKLLFPERFRNYRKNPNFTPEQIIYAFYQTYPLGMTKIIPIDTLKNIYKKNTQQGGKAAREWISGLEYYRANYLDRH